MTCNKKMDGCFDITSLKCVDCTEHPLNKLNIKQDLDEKEYYERECGEMCSHYDELNRCCWLSWCTKSPGDPCDYDFSTRPYGDFKMSEEKNRYG